MQSFAVRDSSENRPWSRHRLGAGAAALSEGSEPAWARRTKWALLVVALVLVAGTLFELYRTLLVLAQSPVAIVTTLPPLAVSPDPPPARPRNDSGPELATAKTVSPSPSGSEPAFEAAKPEHELLRVEELRRLRRMLERSVRTNAPRPTVTPASSNHQALLPGIARTAAPRRSALRRSRPEQALRIVSGPRVRLIGADALVEVEVENRLSSRFQRTVALELLVDGKQRQRRRIVLRIPPGSRLHLSERFSTTLPDGTYSARLTVPPLG